MVSINGIQIGMECYPNNERILKTYNRHAADFTIEFKYETDIDISILIMCKKYLDDKFNGVKVNLNMKYVPYSRMDRSIEGNMFSLKYFCQLVNDLNFNEVRIFDPHSNVTSGLLDRCFEISVSGFVQHAISKLNYNVDYIFFPDNGACKRYSEILSLTTPYFFGNKKRNLKTGEIINYELIDCPNIKGKNILIVDDLCAKGFTFYNAAQKLKEKGADNVYLYVSHCENSIYKGKLISSKIISKIFTTDSILTDWSSSLIEEVY